MFWTVYLSAGLTVLLGLGALFAPQLAAQVTGLAIREDLPHSVSEIRTVFGGLLIGLGASVLILGAPLGAWILASGWICAALARIVSIRLDKALTAHNVLSTIFELALGLALLA
jgi:hypothetical protein